jgi:hypothetical protein
VVVVDLQILFILDVGHILAQDAVHISFGVDFLNHFAPRFFVSDHLVNLFHDRRVKSRFFLKLVLQLSALIPPVNSALNEGQSFVEVLIDLLPHRL